MKFVISSRNLLEQSVEKGIRVLLEKTQTPGPLCGEIIIPIEVMREDAEPQVSNQPKPQPNNTLEESVLEQLVAPPESFKEVNPQAFIDAILAVQDAKDNDGFYLIRKNMDYMVVQRIAAFVGIIPKPNSQKQFRELIAKAEEKRKCKLRCSPGNISSYAQYITGEYPDWKPSKELDLYTFNRYKILAKNLLTEYYRLCVIPAA